MARWFVASLVLVLVVGLFGAACGGGDETGDNVLVLRASDELRFEPSSIVVRVGERVSIRLDNSRGSTLHDLSIDQLPTSQASIGESSEHAGHGPPMVIGSAVPTQLHVAADAGKTASLEFVPTQPGRYAFYCSVAGHRQGGMEGVIVVEA